MIKLYNMDCMEALREMEDNQFDLAIVDPPYGIGAGSEKFKNGSSKTEKPYFKANDWDLCRPSYAYFKELRRVSVNQIIWGGNYFSDMLPPFRCFISWDKTIHGNSYADCELAWTSFDRVARYFRENIAQVNSEGRIHPTQKSVTIYKWLLTNYGTSKCPFCDGTGYVADSLGNPELCHACETTGKKKATILDTHLGSGSIAIACHDLGFDLTGYELDADYYAAACERLKKHQSQVQFCF